MFYSVGVNCHIDFLELRYFIMILNNEIILMPILKKKKMYDKHMH